MDPASLPLLHPLPVKVAFFSQPGFLFSNPFIYFFSSQVVPVVHLYGLLRKSGHVHPNQCRSLTAIEINPIRELRERGALAGGKACLPS